VVAAEIRPRRRGRQLGRSVKVLKYVGEDLPEAFKGDRYFVLGESDEFYDALLMSFYDTNDDDEPVYVHFGLHLEIAKITKGSANIYVEDLDWFRNTTE
jgi:hypothetical protein